MQNKFTLHTHTVGFDGQNTVAEMVNCAKNLGFHTIGISNHFIVSPKIKNSNMYPYAVMNGYRKIYSESFDEAEYKFLFHYYEEIERIREQFPTIQILRGMEVDFFDTKKWRKGFEQVVADLQPDYIIGSTHFVDYKGRLTNSHDWKQAGNHPEIQDEMLKIYWENLTKAAESGFFNWMAHLDLPKKVGLGREEKWAELESRAMESIAKSKTAIEINTSGYKTGCDEPYPSPRILQMAKDQNVPVLISDDAHKIADIGRHFDKAEQLIRTFNLKRFVR